LEDVKTRLETSCLRAPAATTRVPSTFEVHRKFAVDTLHQRFIADIPLNRDQAGMQIVVPLEVDIDNADTAVEKLVLKDASKEPGAPRNQHRVQCGDPVQSVSYHAILERTPAASEPRA
jgi:hypothetical protein